MKMITLPVQILTVNQVVAHPPLCAIQTSTKKSIKRAASARSASAARLRISVTQLTLWCQEMVCV